ncbi:MAG: hypothetical protein V1918_02510 [Planctomycetota bacterium]
MQEKAPSEDPRFAFPPAEFLASLTTEEAMLIRIRDELYDGSWANMQMDLQNRLSGRPYIFKLVSRIEHDLGAVRLLSLYESTRGINLAEVENKETP